MARQLYDAKIRVNFDNVNDNDEPIASGDLLEVIIAKLIAKILAINRECDELIKIPDYSGEKAGRVLRYIGNTSPYIAWTDEAHISLFATGYTDDPTVLEHGGKIYPITNMSYNKENRQIKFVVTPMQLPELPENIGDTAEALTNTEIDGACDYLPTDDSGIKPLTDEQIDTICVG